MGDAREPKRSRGKQRVALLLQAAAALFAEKGYAAATMTEIAARASTAIGSLYQFFPSKQAIAEALLQQYSSQLYTALEAAAKQVEGYPSAQLADVLIDQLLQQRTVRQLATMIVDGIEHGPDRRNDLRQGVRQRLAAVLRAWQPDLAGERLASVTAVVLQLMKAAVTLADESSLDDAAVKEIRHALAIYLDQLRQP